VISTRKATHVPCGEWVLLLITDSDLLLIHINISRKTLILWGEGSFTTPSVLKVVRISMQTVRPYVLLLPTAPPPNEVQILVCILTLGFDPGGKAIGA
jgi:hypothetical protein